MGKRKSAERASEPVTQSRAAQDAAKQERIEKAVTAFAADCVHAAIIPLRQSTNGKPYKSFSCCAEVCVCAHMFLLLLEHCVFC